ncbi:MAG: EamA family transporter [Gammaproteobacteria bacterium]|jgi:drug/metabolite transporter (DMT)-like permease|nr:EamA family transporter [Gammaproteobacteria bacterium]
MIKAQHLRAYALLIVTTLCWGLNAIISRLAVGEISPMQLVTFRWLGVVLLLLVFARRQIIIDWPVLRRHLPFLFLMGSCGFTAFNALFYVAGHYTGAINIGILQGSIPIFVLLGSLLILRHPISVIQGVGVIVTLLGVVIVASRGNPGELAALAVNRGDLLMLIACFFYAAYSIGLTRRPNVSALALFAIMGTVAWLVSLPLVAVETWQQGWTPPSAMGWFLVMLVTLLPSFVAQISFIHGVALIGPGRAGVFVNLVPVFASIMAVIFLQEVFELYHALALALVLGGIWLSEIGKTRHA